MKGPEGQPPSRIQEVQKILPFFHWKDHVVRRIVRQIGVRRTEHGHNPHASNDATEGETGHDGLAGAPVVEAKELLPAILSEQIVELFQACGVLPTFLNHQSGEKSIVMIAVARVAKGAAVEDTPEFPGNDTVGNGFRVSSDPADLDFRFLLQKST